MKLIFNKQVKDNVSGFVGKTTAYIVPLGNIPLWGIQPVIDKDGKLPEQETFHENSIVVLSEDESFVVNFPEFEITLGDEVLSKFAKVKGITTSRTYYHTGCTQLLIQPPLDKDGKFTKGHWTLEVNCELVKKKSYQKVADTGGPLENKPPRI